MDTELIRGGGMNEADVEMRPFELLSVVCTLGGAQCPLVDAERVEELIRAVRRPACRIKLVSDADQMPYYGHMTPEDWAAVDPQVVLNWKRDLDVLQRVGLTPGAVTRSRVVFEELFKKITTLDGVCAFDTPNWEGCEHAREGVYERVRADGAGQVVSIPDDEEYRRRRAASVPAVERAERLVMQPHILMCMCCDYNGGQGGKPRVTDDIYEIRQRIEANPDIEITLVPGDLCMACSSCDGFDDQAVRCVHGGGLIRNYKKNMDVLQKLGLMPGATLTAREYFDLLFERVPSTRDVCAYGDGQVTAPAWSICNSPDGSPSYARTRENRFV